MENDTKDWRGLYAVSGSKDFDFMVVVKTGSVMFKKLAGGLVDGDGVVVNVADLDENIGFSVCKQEPLRSKLLERTWEILH